MTHQKLWALCFLIFCADLACPAHLRADSATSGLERQIDAVASRIQTQYPFKLAYKDFSAKSPLAITYQPADKKDYRDLLAYLKLFEEEIRKYPKSFFDNARLEKVVFVKKFFNGEQPVEGFYARDEHLIFMDFLRSKGNPITQRHNVHHEFYHMMEAQMAGDPGRNNPEWALLNDATFVYRKENVLRQDSAAPFFGFTSEYAMVSPEEDRAEVYACLLISSQSKIAHRWMRHDTVLKKKVDYIKMLVHMFCDEMDAGFWQIFLNSKK